MSSREDKMPQRESSAHYREHEVEFLQRRAKLWLEAVLGETYENLTLAELIADGNLLYRVSKYITREMTGASPGPQEMSPKTLSEVSASGRSSGKYLPYANVDSFLKTCRKVGLTDVELFTPGDVVEGKDIRRVCTSIRSLARKARSQQIRVPDFEDVNRPLPMPKDKVVEIKENLQHSNSTLTTPTAATPEADIQKSERVQIISRFLSATKASPANGAEESNPSDGSVPVTPGPLKSLSSNNLASLNSPSTPAATIGGIGTPALTKSVSVIEPSPATAKSSESSFVSNPKMASDGPKLGKSPSSVSLSSAKPVDQSYTLPLSYSQKGLGSFRHAQPHFTKKSSSQSSLHSAADDSPDDAAPPESKAERIPSAPSNSEYPADETKELSSSPKDLGANRDVQPDVSLGKSSKAHSTVASPSSQDLQSKSSGARPEEDAPKAPAVKPRAPSSNKIVEKDPRSTTPQAATPAKISSRQSAKSKVTQGPTAPAKEPSSKPEAKVPVIQLNLRLWMPIAAGALAFLGTLLVARNRDPDPGMYKVKEGDTLSKISKKVGQNSWDELVKLNPSIMNPNLIYPSERLKLPS